MPEISELTQEKFEQNLSEQVMNLYLTYLGHQVSKVSCQLVNQTLTIVVDNSITQPEQLLINIGQQELAKKVRLHLEQAIEPRLKKLIEEAINLPVNELLTSFSLDTGCSSIVATLASTEEVKQQQVFDADRNE